MDTKNNGCTPNVLRYLRGSRGVSMQEVADATGICSLTVFSLEHGRMPRLGSLQKLADYYGVSLDCIARNDIAAAAAQLYATKPCSSHQKDHFREKQEKCDSIGDKGEQIVIDKEKARLAGTAFAEAVNGEASKDMNAGYDVLSFDRNGQPIFIEVKTTTYQESSPFYVSRKELEFLKDCKNKGKTYQMHRVYELDDRGDCKIHVLSADELLEDYVFIPATYIVRRRTNK